MFQFVSSSFQSASALLCIFVPDCQISMFRKRTAPRPNLRQKSIELEVEESEEQESDEKLE